MSAVNYSKWDHIEISDDEDDTHPNVDNASLFRWRHQARIEREEKERADAAKRNAEIKLAAKKVEELKKKKTEVADDTEVKKIDSELSETERQYQEYLAKEAEIEREQKLHPKWNVDNISKPKSDRTLINKPTKKAPQSEEEEMTDLNAFFKKNSKRCEKFAMMVKTEESRKFLNANPDLVCQHLGSYLVIWAIDMQVEEKFELVKIIARQAVIANYIMELAKTLDRDPRGCVDAFFARFEKAEKEYRDAFEDEVQQLLGRIADRAKIRLEEAAKQVAKEEAEEREKRLGPAGLDPLEVLAELPAKMREAFETQNTPMLQESFAELPPDQMQEIYAKVVGSGLWVPAKGADDEGEEAAAAAAADDEEASAAAADES